MNYNTYSQSKKIYLKPKNGRISLDTPPALPVRSVHPDLSGLFLCVLCIPTCRDSLILSQFFLSLINPKLYQIYLFGITKTYILHL